MDKRTFSAGERRRDARSGAAESDGSFPIENAGDLRNAMRAIGRSKNPAKTKAHIRARARALGLTSQLSDAFKREDSTLLKALRFIKDFGVSKERLADSLVSIIEDETALNKAELARETIEQFQEAVEADLDKSLTEGVSVEPSDEDKMFAEVAKALGLADTATEEDVIAAVAKRDQELAKAKEAAEAAAAEVAKAELAKAAAEKEELAKRIAVLEHERELAAFQKTALDLGLPQAKAEVLMKARKGDVAAVDEVFAMLKAANAANEEGEVFKEFGSSQGSASDDPIDQLKAKAAELRKLKPELSEQQAFARVYTDPANAKLAKAERRANRPAA